MSSPRTFTIPDPSADDACPHVPDGATPSEAQNIENAWRNVLRSATDACSRIQYVAAHPTSLGAANDAQAVGQMLMAQGLLIARVEAVVRRVALLERGGS